MQNYDSTLYNGKNRDIAVSRSWPGWPRNSGPLRCRGEEYSSFETDEISSGAHTAYKFRVT